MPCLVGVEGGGGWEGGGRGCRGRGRGWEGREGQGEVWGPIFSAKKALKEVFNPNIDGPIRSYFLLGNKKHLFFIIVERCLNIKRPY